MIFEDTTIEETRGNTIRTSYSSRGDVLLKITEPRGSLSRSIEIAFSPQCLRLLARALLLVADDAEERERAKSRGEP